jgi:hypothetical protein
MHVPPQEPLYPIAGKNANACAFRWAEHPDAKPSKPERPRSQVSFRVHALSREQSKPLSMKTVPSVRNTLLINSGLYSGFDNHFRM